MRDSFNIETVYTKRFPAALWLNDSCAGAMRPFVKLFWPHVIIRCSGWGWLLLDFHRAKLAVSY